MNKRVLFLFFLSSTLSNLGWTDDRCEPLLSSSPFIEPGDVLLSDLNQEFTLLDKISGNSQHSTYHVRAASDGQRWELTLFHSTPESTALTRGTARFQRVIQSRLKEDSTSRLSPFVQLALPSFRFELEEDIASNSVHERVIRGSLSETSLPVGLILHPQNSLQQFSNTQLATRLVMAEELMHATQWLWSESLVLTRLQPENIILLGQGPAGISTVLRGNYAFAIASPELISVLDSGRPEILALHTEPSSRTPPNNQTMAFLVGKVVLESLFDFEGLSLSPESLHNWVENQINTEQERLSHSASPSAVERLLILERLAHFFDFSLRKNPLERSVLVRPVSEINSLIRLQKARAFQLERARRLKRTLE